MRLQIKFRSFLYFLVGLTFLISFGCTSSQECDLDELSYFYGDVEFFYTIDSLNINPDNVCEPLSHNMKAKIQAKALPDTTFILNERLDDDYRGYNELLLGDLWWKEDSLKAIEYYSVANGKGCPFAALRLVSINYRQGSDRYSFLLDSIYNKHGDFLAWKSLKLIIASLRGDVEIIDTYLEDIPRTYPDSELWYELCYFFLQTNRIQKAKEFIALALKFDPKNAEFLYMSAAVNLEIRDCIGMRTNMQKVLAQEKNAFYLKEFAWMEYQCGYTKKGEDLFKELIRKFPSEENYNEAILYYFLEGEKEISRELSYQSLDEFGKGYMNQTAELMLMQGVTGKELAGFKQNYGEQGLKYYREYLGRFINYNELLSR